LVDIVNSMNTKQQLLQLTKGRVYGQQSFKPMNFTVHKLAKAIALTSFFTNFISVEIHFTYKSKLPDTIFQLN